MSFKEWKKCKVSDILNFRRGHDLPKKKVIEGEYPVVGSNGVIAYHNEYTTKAPCLTIGRSGNVGNPHFLNEDCWAHNTTLYVDDFKGNHPEFIYYFLKTLNLGHYAGGSAVPTLNRNHIHPIEIMFPGNIEEQKAITNILSSLDGKIETNNTINQKLEEIAQTIFKQWFVDFEFPNEEGKAYKANGGEMVESELGMIPEGWEIKILDDLSKDDIICGKTPSTKKKENYGDFMPFVTIPDMHNNTFIINTSRSLSREGVANQVKKTVPKYSVMVSCIATPGLVSIASRDCQTNQQINTIICPEFSSYFIYFSLKNLSEHIKILGSSGSTTLNLNKREFGKIKVVYPNQSYLEVFYETVKAMFEQILNNQLQNKELTILRNALLPKLMSGEIRV
ncbi:restriction endonuclease subunit S [Bacillus cereus]|uniref:restriction endonuclease subunit S n=1 Tax=Bacillus cereus TaxID=1396 RepID=UPI00296EB8C5|nr:restriction endonuclease subunit S [Bacillus cereus]MDW4539405.1 restriction endonuclease subunit S [Bacillus cereus]